MTALRKKAEVFLEYQGYIEAAPVSNQQLFAQAASNDTTTINFWRDQWIRQIKANHAVYGPFKNNSIAKLYKKELHKPCFLLGSGPSLKKNVHLLAQHKDLGIPIVSCLHNFAYLEDLGVPVDYYVTLDAGDVVIKEVSESGNSETDYFAKSKGKKLLAFIGTHPNLLAKWQGEIYFFNAPVPDAVYEQSLREIEKFPLFVSSGGNVLGACMYIAKAYLGCHTSIFLGADFSFSYNENFYSWPHELDKDLGNTLKVPDVYGIPVKTWPSYNNFKSYFDCIAQSVPGNYINCTEGGTLGAYWGGNIFSIKCMDLSTCIEHFSLSDNLKQSIEDPEGNHQFKILF